ncbi:MAG: valine--tRNA ligase [Candidatus Nezhaarchaeota archaeon]|nr:valine--tRNA ligase [Candidatus Nezhaarchaeota archaeon]
MMSFKPSISEPRWNHQIEEELLRKWEEEGLYRFNPSSGKPIFSIDTPPPYPSGPWHVGAAAHYAQIDMVARYFRMKGYEVLFAFGIDRNGLPVEVQVEREYHIKAHEVGRERFLELCSSFLDRIEQDIVRIARRLGLSCDLKNYYRTDSPDFRALTQATFIELWNRGLVYQAERPTNWCPGCRTTIADAEVEYEDRETELVYIKFKVKDANEHIVIATTRPELLCTCAAVVFNPSDQRYIHLEGFSAVVPIYGQAVPIIAHSYAKPEFGTGLVMLCSFGDYGDIRLFRELGLKARIAIDADGKMNNLAGPYAGLTVEEARRKIIEDLEELGLIERRERVIHRTPVCWRSKDPVEFIVMPEYYLRQVEFKEKLLKVIDKINFHPPEHKQLLIDWINSVSTDWPISRRRFYGTEIPIWYCRACGKPNLPPPGRYYRPWREPPPFNRCECGSEEFIGEERTFDTWMDSSGSELYVAGFMRNEELFYKAFPCSLRPQGIDIVRTWLYYTLLKATLLFDKPAFLHVRLSGMGLDEHGEAMHKSKGNVIYPWPVLETYGADAFRLWSAAESKLGSNYRFSESHIKSARLFLTKLWNIARFISSFPKPESGFKLTKLDLMALAELNRVTKECREAYDKMDVFVPANAIRDYTWSFFADHYLEAVKPRAYNTDDIFTQEEQYGAWYTLHTCLETVLKLLAPVCPFITDALWRRLRQGSVHTQPLPSINYEWGMGPLRVTQLFIEFNSTVWQLKKANRKPLTSPLNVIIYAPRELADMAQDLQAMHKIEKLYFDSPPPSAIEIGPSIYMVRRQA